MKPVPVTETSVPPSSAPPPGDTAVTVQRSATLSELELSAKSWALANTRTLASPRLLRPSVNEQTISFPDIHVVYVALMLPSTQLVLGKKLLPTILKATLDPAGRADGCTELIVTLS